MVTQDQLRQSVIESLKHQGFRLVGSHILPPADLTKEKLRDLHAEAVRHRIEKSKEGLVRHEASLLKRLASGSEIIPSEIVPKLVEVAPDSEDELLFRFATLHWSIPVSPGYGRRLRFLVIDGQNQKLIGVFGLGDPVFSLGDRDKWVGWTKETRKTQLHHVMDGYVLGAVPPYSFLLCGKLVAMLAASTEVRETFGRKYSGRPSLIRGRTLKGQLALITTTSALGQSSIYNRLKYDQHLLYQRVGFTRGYGEFHFANGLYDAISVFTAQNCEPTAKHKLWGGGFRSRREVVRKCLTKLGLSTQWLHHGIQREIFVVPLAQNAREFLRGEESHLHWYDYSAERLFGWFRERWLLPRSRWDQRYKDWDAVAWSIWTTGGSHA